MGKKSCDVEALTALQNVEEVSALHFDDSAIIRCHRSPS